MKNKITFCFGLLTLSIFILSCSKKDDLVLADSSISWWMAPTIIANEKIDNETFYEKNGLTVNTFDMQTGLASLNAVLSGSADLGIVASTPIATSLANHKNIKILCSFVTSKSLLGLIVKEPNSDAILNSEPINPVAIVPGTISEWYFRFYVDKNSKKSKDDFNLLKIKPADIPNALKNGDAKSAVIWEPFLSYMSNDNPNYKIFRDSTLYEQRIYLVTRQDVLESKQKQLIKFIKALTNAVDYIQNKPNETQNILIKKYSEQRKSMETLWKYVDFSLHYDFEKMIDLIKKDASVIKEVNPDSKIILDDTYRNLFDVNFTKLVTNIK